MGDPLFPFKFLREPLVCKIQILFQTFSIPAKEKEKLGEPSLTQTKCPSSSSAGAVQSSIGCLCQNTRAAAATAAPSNTSSPSAATTTSGRGHPAALSSHWLPHHSPTRPTGPSAWVAQWGRLCRLRGWRGAQPSHAVSAVMAGPWTPRG